MSSPVNQRFVRYAWGTIAYNILVILWGAFVRATGSGAGCGSHWPLCNGEVIPRPEAIETMIEFSHRVTSGFALISTVILLVWAFRAYPKGDLVRKAAVASMVLMVIEALIGAGLVLLELVATNVSAARAVAMALHLANTFLLLGALTMTAWWAGGGAPLQLKGRGKLVGALVAAYTATIFVGSSGAVTALGDTLLKLGAIPGGLSQPLGASGHFLVELRIIHPILGFLTSIYIMWLGRLALQRNPDPQTRNLAYATVGLFWAQVLIGGLNVTLKAPVAMQLIHLLMADIIWIVLVCLGAALLAMEQTATAARSTAVQRTPQRA